MILFFTMEGSNIKCVRQEHVGKVIRLGEMVPLVDFGPCGTGYGDRMQRALEGGESRLALDLDNWVTCDAN